MSENNYIDKIEFATAPWVRQSNKLNLRKYYFFKNILAKSYKMAQVSSRIYAQLCFFTDLTKPEQLDELLEDAQKEAKLDGETLGDDCK